MLIQTIFIRTLLKISADTLDLEVSHIIEAGDKFESSDSIGMADDMGPRNPRQLVTAQSVIQFMKKVKRFHHQVKLPVHSLYFL